MKISTILDKIDENQLFVPAFQREYVWKRDDAKQLLDSLIKQYPTGTMLTWETNEPPELKGQYKYDRETGRSEDSSGRAATCHNLVYAHSRQDPHRTTALPRSPTTRAGLHVNVETRELEYYSQRKMENDTRWRNITAIFQKTVRTKDIYRDLEQKGETVDRAREDLLMTTCKLSRTSSIVTSQSRRSR